MPCESSLASECALYPENTFMYPLLQERVEITCVADHGFYGSWLRQAKYGARNLGRTNSGLDEINARAESHATTAHVFMKMLVYPCQRASLSASISHSWSSQPAGWPTTTIWTLSGVTHTVARCSRICRVVRPEEMSFSSSPIEGTRSEQRVHHTYILAAQQLHGSRNKAARHGRRYILYSTLH